MYLVQSRVQGSLTNGLPPLAAHTCDARHGRQG